MSPVPVVGLAPAEPPVWAEELAQKQEPLSVAEPATLWGQGRLAPLRVRRRLLFLRGLAPAAVLAPIPTPVLVPVPA